MTDQQVDRLVALLESLPSRIAAAIVSSDRTRVPHGPHREELAALLDAIYRSVNGRVFSARELIAHAAIPANLHLRVAIEAVVRDRDAGRTLGSAFRKVVGTTLAGLRLERRGADRDGVIWAVVRVSD